MSGVDLVVGPLPGWAAYVLLFLASLTFYASATYAYKAVWHWMHPVDQVSDASIREVLKNIKTPPYWLYSLVWGAVGILELTVALLVSDILR